MSKLIPGNQKHLTLEDRQYIEQSLNRAVPFRDIARFLCKDPTTISKEVRKYRELLSSSREGINMTRQELRRLDAVISPLIAQGQSPYQIVENHPELDVSVRTCYSYIDQGLLCARNIDLKRKAKFKPRKCHRPQIRDRSVFVGRTPYQAALEAFGPDVLKALQLRPVDPDEVNLTPKLIK